MLLCMNSTRTRQIGGTFFRARATSCMWPCGAAPVYVAMYELDEDKADRRHLLSRKSYLLHVAMWSDLKPPLPTELESILGAEGLAVEGRKQQKEAENADRSSIVAGFFGCCGCRDDKHDHVDHTR